MGKRAQSFDVCIVCALYEEAEAVLTEFSTRCKVSFDKEFSGTDLYEYRYTTIQNNRGEPLTILVTWLADNGPVRTGLHLKPFLQEFHPRFAAMTGICAGYKEKDVRLGDLIVAESAYHYEVGKDTLEKDGQKKHELQTTTYGVTPQVLQYVRSFQDWREPVARLKRPKRKQEKINGSEPLKERPPTRYIAPMASGMAVKEDESFPWLREHINRKTLALEMEAATFYLTLQEVSSLGIHSLVVKGVSDYADGSKNDEYHTYAERASAIYLLYFIREYVTRTTMPRRSSPSSSIRDGPSEVWNVPYRRNPLFTGREELLKKLEDTLHNGQVTALSQPQAISGLGGIGKTQVAIEYAYRHAQDYRAVLWIAADSREALIAGFVKLAELLELPECEEQEQLKAVAAVKHWLERHTDWLLIFDNADEIQLVEDFLPQSSSGHILLTTRSHNVGPNITALRVEVMSLLEGALLLLRRAKLIAPEASLEHLTEGTQEKMVNQAVTLVDLLEGLPLALNQAGAYIEKTGCSLETYLHLYQTRHQKLLAERDPFTPYPASVATTWDLSFGKVKEANPAAAELLQLCAFLAPDGIPEELIVEGTGYWPTRLKKAAGDCFTLERAIEAARAYSLLERRAEQQTLSMHRLVQAILKDRLVPRIQRRWAERVVKAVDHVFPSGLQVEQWPQCLRYLAQAQECWTLIEQYRLQQAEASDLLGKTANYLSKHALYAEAEPLYLCALAIRERQLGPEHLATAISLNNLAELYRNQGKYEQAEPLYQQALLICERQHGPEHTDTASSLSNLATLYYEQSKFEQAEPLFRRALAIRKRQLGPEHPATALSLNNLAALYKAQGKYKQAEPLYERALLIREQQLGLHHLDTAQALNNLALLYKVQGKYEQAVPLYEHALAVEEHLLGPEHPNTAQSLNNLAALYYVQGKYKQAEPLYQRALAIREHALGPEHPSTAQSLNNLATLYHAQNRYDHAIPLYERALAAWEHLLGPEHPNIALSLNNLANLYEAQGKNEQAIPLYERAIAILGHSLGGEHPHTITVCKNYVLLLRTLGYEEEARKVEVRFRPASELPSDDVEKENR